MIANVTKFINLKDKQFFITPKPQEDEILSSWLCRIALAHQTKPASFVNMHFPKYKNIIFRRDLDIWAPNDLIEEIAYKSKYAEKEILDLTLLTCDKEFDNITIYKNSYSKNILPLINRGGINRGYGQRFCLKCLKTDSIKYFKKSWRIKFIDKCKIHNIDLSDRCPNCGKPITIYKVFQTSNVIKCYFCLYTICTENHI